MTDEAYVFVSDAKEKKRIARGSFNKRTHAGKGGMVKFPSDFLSRKELKAMNGEVQSYRLNSPMTWEEFKEMPEDLQELYINKIREKFNAPDSKIAEMFLIHAGSFARYARDHGFGKGKRGKVKDFDEEGFAAWRFGISSDNSNECVAEEVEQEIVAECVRYSDININGECCISNVVPTCGNLMFRCNANEALAIVGNVLDDSLVEITVSWTVIRGEQQ